MSARLRLCAVFATTVLAAAAHAQTHLRPGLWEETVKSSTDGAQAGAAAEQMKQRLAAMTPERRAAMEKMMASHPMPGNGAPGVMRVCITKEQAERGLAYDSGGHCTRSNIARSGNVVHFDFACTTGHATSTGTGTFTEMGDSAFAVSTTSDTVSPKMTMHIQSDISGKFVSSDCGNVKPFEAPAAK